MRVRSALLATLCATLAPMLARAQTTIGTYRVQGCADGVVRYDRVNGFLVGSSGRVACFDGFAEITLRLFDSGDGVPPVPELRVTPTLTATFGPQFAAPTLFTEGFAVNFDYNRSNGASGQSGFSQGLESFSWRAPGGTSTAASLGEPLPRDAILGSLRVTTSTLYLRYRLPDAPGNDANTTIAALTFTATPEPATWALVAVGGLALAGVVARRRRA